jgi:hypothetical protein
MDNTNQIFCEASAYPKKCVREAFSPDAGQGSRAIIPGDDPGDQQQPERRGFDPDPYALAADAMLARIRVRRRAG